MAPVTRHSSRSSRPAPPPRPRTRASTPSAPRSRRRCRRASCRRSCPPSPDGGSTPNTVPASAAPMWAGTSTTSSSPPTATSSCSATSPARASGQLTLAVGGHPLPLLKRADGVEKLGATGMLLGAVHDYERAADVTVAVASGDTLLLYTDGVTDTPG